MYIATIISINQNWTISPNQKKYKFRWKCRIFSKSTFQEYTPIINFHIPVFAERLFKSALVSLHRICFPVAPFSLLLLTTDNVRPQHPPVCLTVWMNPFPCRRKSFISLPFISTLLHFTLQRHLFTRCEIPRNKASILLISQKNIRPGFSTICVSLSVCLAGFH